MSQIVSNYRPAVNGRRARGASRTGLMILAALIRRAPPPATSVGPTNARRGGTDSCPCLRVSPSIARTGIHDFGAALSVGV
jgi:hypothetical protein